MLELSIRPSITSTNTRGRVHAFIGISTRNLFLRLLKGVVRVRYGLRKIRACLTVSNLIVKRDDASYGIRATSTVDNATRPTSCERCRLRLCRTEAGVRPARSLHVLV